MRGQPCQSRNVRFVRDDVPGKRSVHAYRLRRVMYAAPHQLRWGVRQSLDVAKLLRIWQHRMQRRRLSALALMQRRHVWHLADMPWRKDLVWSQLHRPDNDPRNAGPVGSFAPSQASSVFVSRSMPALRFWLRHWELKIVNLTSLRTAVRPTLPCAFASAARANANRRRERAGLGSGLYADDGFVFVARATAPS